METNKTATPGLCAPLLRHLPLSGRIGIALSIITALGMVLVGVLSLANISNINALGTPGGASFIGTGAFCLLIITAYLFRHIRPSEPREQGLTHEDPLQPPINIQTTQKVETEKSSPPITNSLLKEETIQEELFQPTKEPKTNQNQQNLPPTNSATPTNGQPKVTITEEKSSEEQPVTQLSQTVLNQTLPQRPKVIICTSITAAPPTEGHLSMVATGSRKLLALNFEVVEILIALAPQKYFDGKKGIMEHYIRYTYEERQTLLNTLLEGDTAKKMFGNIPVRFWDDQIGYTYNKWCDHPDSYVSLQQKHPDKMVVFVAGSDLCPRMRDWPGTIPFAVLVTRGEGDKDTVIERNEKGDIMRFIFKKSVSCPQVQAEDTPTRLRLLVDNAFPELESVSSTKIRSNIRNAAATKIQRVCRRALFIKKINQRISQRMQIQNS